MEIWLERLRMKCVGTDARSVRFQAAATGAAFLAVYVLFFAFVPDSAAAQREMQVLAETPEEEGHQTSGRSEMDGSDPVQPAPEYVASFLEGESPEDRRRSKLVTMTETEFREFFHRLPGLQERIEDEYVEARNQLLERKACFASLLHSLTDQAPELLTRHPEIGRAWRNVNELLAESGSLAENDPQRPHLEAIRVAKSRLLDRRLTVGELEDVHAAGQWLDQSLQQCIRAEDEIDRLLSLLRQTEHPLAASSLEPTYTGRDGPASVLTALAYRPSSIDEESFAPKFRDLLSRPPRVICEALIRLDGLGESPVEDGELPTEGTPWQREVSLRAKLLSRLLAFAEGTGEWSVEQQLEFEELVPATFDAGHRAELYAAFRADQQLPGNEFRVREVRLDPQFAVSLRDGRRVGEASRRLPSNRSRYGH